MFLIIKCGALKKGSSLRNFFENSKNNLIIPCYEESKEDKKKLVSEFFASEYLKITNEEINLLVDLISNERLEIKNELSKLAIYIKNNKKNLIDSLGVITENSNDNFNQLIFSLFSKDKKGFLKMFFKSKEIQSDSVRSINFLSEHLMKILEVKGKIKSGYEKSSSIKSLRPPVFFKYLPEFNKHIDMWSEKNITFLLRKLFFCQSSTLKGLKTSEFELYFLFLKILNFKING